MRSRFEPDENDAWILSLPDYPKDNRCAVTLECPWMLLLPYAATRRLDLAWMREPVCLRFKKGWSFWWPELETMFRYHWRGHLTKVRFDSILCLRRKCLKPRMRHSEKVTLSCSKRTCGFDAECCHLTELTGVVSRKKIPFLMNNKLWHIRCLLPYCKA